MCDTIEEVVQYALVMSHNPAAYELRAHHHNSVKGEGHAVGGARGSVLILLPIPVANFLWE
eukprot:6486369-Amphidinium_carterae.1